MFRNQRMVEGALLLALSVILTRYFSIRLSFYGVDGVRIGMGITPIIIAGLRYDIRQGAKVGALADLAGYLIIPNGPYMPHFTIISALYGILPSLLVGNKVALNPARIIIAVSVTIGLLSLVVTPYFLFQLFGIPYQVIIIPRLVSFVLNVIIINTFLILLNRRVGIIIKDIPQMDNRQ